MAEKNKRPQIRKDGKPRASKPTAHERIERVNVVLELMTMYQPRQTILRYCHEKWGLTEHASDDLMFEARAVFRNAANFDRQEMIGKGIAVREKIIRKSMETENLMQAGITQSDLDRLAGVYAPSKQEVDVRDLTQKSIEDLMAEKAALEAKLAKFK